MQTVCKQCRPEHHDVTRHTLMRIILSPQVHHFPHAQIRRTILNELFPVLTEGDTFTDLDGHVGLVNVLIDSLLKKYVFPLCNREVSLISILFIRIFFFYLHRRQMRRFLSLEQSGRTMLWCSRETRVKSTYTKQTASGYIFQNKTSFSVRATQLRTRLPKKGYEL